MAAKAGGWPLWCLSCPGPLREVPFAPLELVKLGETAAGRSGSRGLVMGEIEGGEEKGWSQLGSKVTGLVFRELSA